MYILTTKLLKDTKTVMEEEEKLPEPKQLKTIFVGDTELPVHFVNAVNVRAGLEEFYFTLGTTTPLEITDIKELEDIETIAAHATFRFVVTRSVMRQIIEVMKSVYDSQTQQLDALHAPQNKEQKDNGDGTASSTN